VSFRLKLLINLLVFFTTRITPDCPPPPPFPPGSGDVDGLGEDDGLAEADADGEGDGLEDMVMTWPGLLTLN
jgi:hypothetical protein